LSFKILIHVDFNLLSFIQLSALVGQIKVIEVEHIRYFFIISQQPLVEQGLLIVEDS